MIDDLLLSHARRLWAELAGAPVVFAAGGVDVAVSPSSRLCPPGWVGIVALAGSTIVTAPHERAAEVVRRELGGRAGADVTEPGFVRNRLPVDAVLGPATLAYCDAGAFRPSEAPRSWASGGASASHQTAAPGGTVPVHGTPASSGTVPVGGTPAPGGTVPVRGTPAPGGTVPATGTPSPGRTVPATGTPAPAGRNRPTRRQPPADETTASGGTVLFGRVERVAGAELAPLVGRVSAEDAGEAGLDEITSAAFVVRSAGEIVAAAGYEVWPRGTAHLSVLVAPEHRGQGLARVVASAAVADALRVGLVAQWRARPEASRRVARALGFQEIGEQLSIRLRGGPG